MGGGSAESGGPERFPSRSRIRKKKFRSSAAHSSFLTPPYTRG